MLGVTRYKVTHYCNSTTFRGNEHVTKYFFKSSNAVTITEIEISSLLALLSFVNNEHLETRRQDRPTLAASDLTSQDHGDANRYTNRINQWALNHIMADSADRMSFLSWKYGHYFSLVEIKDKNVVVSCKLCADKEAIHIEE